MKKYFTLLIVTFCFSLFGQNYKKIHTYIEKQKFTKARILLDKELRLYKADIYDFPKFSHSAFIHPNLNYLVYRFITAQKSTFSTYDTLDILNWHINHALQYLDNLTDSLQFDYSITNKTLLTTANEMIDQEAYQILKQNHSPRNLEHFITFYSQNFHSPDLPQLVEAYLHSNFIADMTECKTDKICLQTASTYYQNQHEKDAAKTFIRSYTDSLVYNFVLDTNKVADLEFYIRNYPMGHQVVHSQHLIFTKLLKNEILTQAKLKVVVEKYGDLLCQKTDCPFNPSNWLHRESERQPIFLPLQDSESKNFGFKTVAGEVVIAPQYDLPIEYLHSSGFKTDFFKVYINNQLQIIDPKGEVIIPKTVGLDDASDFNSLLISTYKDGFYGLYNKHGFEVLAPQYQSISPFMSDFVKVETNDRLGIVDYLNNIILPVEYDDLIREKDAIFGRVLDTYNLFKMEIIEGKPTFQLKRKVKNFTSYNHVLQVESFAGKIALLDESLNPIIENLDSLEPSGEFFIAKCAAEYFILDSLGQPYFSNLQPVEAFRQNENYWALKFDGLWGLYDRKGQILLYHHYKSVELLSAGAVLTTPDNRTFYYNRDLIAFKPKAKIVQDITVEGKFYAVVGETKLKLIEVGKRTRLTNYDGIEIFENGNILLERGGVKKILNLADLRKNIFRQTFQELLPTKHDLHLFQTFKNSKFGLLHVLDNWLIPNIYQQSIKYYSDSFYIAKKEDALGLINQQNETILDFKFDELKPYTSNFILLKRADTIQIYDLKRRQTLDFTFKKHLITEANTLILRNELGFGILKPDGNLYFKKTYEEPLEYNGGDLVITLDKAQSRLNWHSLKGDNLVNSIILTPEQYRKLKPRLIFGE